jgi:thioredoxin-dependent peroxiredoxin
MTGMGAALAAWLMLGLTVQGADVNVGDMAPKFEALDDQGKPWKSTEHVGQGILVVYFYPADMTGGCTKQACNFRDNLAKLTDAGVQVVGVSGDSVRNHQLFKKVEKLTFPLLADTEGNVAAAFGVPHVKEEKSITRQVDGKDEILVRSVTAQRWTFIIGKDGKILAKNTKVAAGEESAAILKMVADLK